jgi:hypothetical protein
MKNGNLERQVTKFELPDKRIFNLQIRETGEIPVGISRQSACQRRLASQRTCSTLLGTLDRGCVTLN